MLEDIKKHYIWKEAMALSQALIELCEEFADDKNVVVWHVRQSVMDIPASVAIDLQRGSDPSFEPFVRCAAQLELVRRVYPATDTDPADGALQQIFKRIDESAYFDFAGASRQTERVDSTSSN